MTTPLQFRCRLRRSLPLLLLPAITGVAPLAAQQPAGTPGDDPLAGLVSTALSQNPQIQAARLRLEAARARITPAGALPDPMLIAGISNLEITDPDFDDNMAMKMVGVGQMFPYPGKLSLRRRAAALEAAAAGAMLAAERLTVEAQVKKAFYDLAFLDRALNVLHRNRDLLGNFVGVTHARYGVGTGSQQDVLKARVEIARLAEQAVVLEEERRAALARLNSLLDRPVDTPLAEVRFPDRIARAAVPDDVAEIRFSSAALGARAAGSPLPPRAALETAALENNPRLRALGAKIEAQAARAELAGKAHLPDFDISLQYGQRDGRPDMISAAVAIPLPLRRGQRQEPERLEARAELAALEAERNALANEIRAEVARLDAAIERERARLALFVKSIIPQGKASLESATAGFQVGRVDFLTLLDNQATLFDYETEYFRALSDFASALAELERTVGAPILQEER